MNKKTLLQTSVWHAQGQNQPNRTSMCQEWFCHVASPRLLKLGRSRWLENPYYHNNVCNSTRYTPTQTGEKGYLCSAERIPSAGLPCVSSCVHRLSTLKFRWNLNNAYLFFDGLLLRNDEPDTILLVNLDFIFFHFHPTVPVFGLMITLGCLHGQRWETGTARRQQVWAYGGI